MPQFHDPNVPTYSLRFPDKDLRQRFHAACAARGITMRKALIDYCQKVVAEHEAQEKPKG